MSGMRQPPDPYRELGVPRGATDEQIKAAHRRLAKRYHPDGSSGDGTRFLAIQAAYLLLTDPLRRREWDASHAPGPVRAANGPAQGAPMARSRRGSPPRPDVTGQTARTSRGTTRGSHGTARTASPPPREPGTQSYTWSAAGVPWWEDAAPRADRAGPAAPPDSGPGARRGSDPPPRTPPPTSDGPPAEHEPYARSSGTAWSSAARRYFRQGDADLPRGGQFRYRGTQVVTGAEARRVADEELRRHQMADPPHTRAARPEPTRTSGLIARLRRFLGGG